MAAIGHLLGYAIGSIDTVSILGSIFGDTQFKQMTVFAAMFLIGAESVTSYAVKERVLITARCVYRIDFTSITNSRRDSDDKPGAIQVMSQLLKTTMDLPPRIQAICWAQFWAWIGKSHAPYLTITLTHQAGSPSSSTARPGSAKPTFAMKSPKAHPNGTTFSAKSAE